VTLTRLKDILIRNGTGASTGRLDRRHRRRCEHAEDTIICIRWIGTANELLFPQHTSEWLKGRPKINESCGLISDDAFQRHTKSLFARGPKVIPICVVDAIIDIEQDDACYRGNQYGVRPGIHEPAHRNRMITAEERRTLGKLLLEMHGDRPRVADRCVAVNEHRYLRGIRPGALMCKSPRYAGGLKALVCESPSVARVPPFQVFRAVLLNPTTKDRI
jgi:hypothetical protein